VVEGDTGGAAVPPFDYLAIKRLFGGLFMANNGFDKVRANEAIVQGRADLVAFGKPFISNPDLVTRLYLDVPLSPLNRETLYGGAEQGYTDYPVLRTVVTHAWLSSSQNQQGLLPKKTPQRTQGCS
jgi:N-ethylmaleimide reductase